MQLKGNQKSLYEQIQHECKKEIPIDSFDLGMEKAHGRLEHRLYEVFDAQNMLLKWKKDWPYIRHIIKVTRTREIIKNGSMPTTEISYYITNSKDKNADIYAKIIRQHWAIENKNNYIRDTAFNEDKGIRRVNPYIFSGLIDIAKNIMSKNKCKKIKEK
ncbi:MAG: hypothetical protein HEEMFOPI_02052 [Holosporales bacterium]